MTVLLRGGDTGIELVNESIPNGHVVPERAPEGLVATRLEHIQWRSLLLDPCVIPEIEDPVPVTFGAVDHVVGGDIAPVFTKHFGSIDVAEVIIEATSQCLFSLARIQGTAVCGHCDEGVIGSEPKQFLVE